VRGASKYAGSSPLTYFASPTASRMHRAVTHAGGHTSTSGPMATPPVPALGPIRPSCAAAFYRLDCCGKLDRLSYQEVTANLLALGKV
jgi:hypothetical protein